MYGVWNAKQKRFVFGICETTAGRAQRALFHKIGKQAYRWRYDVRKIPLNWKNPPNPNYKKRGGLTVAELEQLMKEEN